MYCVTKISVYYQELELYFKDPKEMLNILTELEEQNLSYIQNFQETEEAMEEIRMNARITKERMYVCYTLGRLKHILLTQ